MNSNLDPKPDQRGPYTARRFVTPRMVMSQCLELEACRYDGQRIRNPVVRQLMDFVDLVPVCPEVEIGLGTPRAPIRLVDESGETRLVQPESGKELTESMHRFSDTFFRRLGPVDGFLLKSGSPSCGTRNVKVYERPARSPTVRHEPGVFAKQVIEQFDHLAIEDEGRLRNFDIRHHFLTRLFSLAELRQLGAEPTMKAMVDFQRRHKHLLLFYDEQRMRQLGRVVANPGRLNVELVYEEFARVFRRALAEAPHRRVHRNVLMHIYGHFKNLLAETERDEFFQMLDEMRDHHLPLSALLTVIRSWCARFKYDYMADQSYLQPYPRKLLLMRDSGKGVVPN